MDGHIWLDSEGIGKGSVVTFVVKLGLPIAQVEATATSASPSLRNRTDFAGVRVLVTDDNRWVKWISTCRPWSSGLIT